MRPGKWHMCSQRDEGISASVSLSLSLLEEKIISRECNVLAILFASNPLCFANIGPWLGMDGPKTIVATADASLLDDSQCPILFTRDYYTRDNRKRRRSRRKERPAHSFSLNKTAVRAAPRARSDWWWSHVTFTVQFPRWRITRGFNATESGAI